MSLKKCRMAQFVKVKFSDEMKLTRLHIFSTIFNGNTDKYYLKTVKQLRGIE